MGEAYYEILLSGPAGREQTIRAALMNAGVGKDDFVPCHHGWEHLEEERAKGWVAYRADDLQAAEIACKKAKGWRLRIHRHAIGLAIQEQVPGPRIDPLEHVRSRLDGLERMVAGLAAENARLRGDPPPIAGGTLESPPWVIKADQHSADLFRQMPQSFLGGTGVVGSGDLLVTPNSPAAMNVLCAAGQVWMPGTIGGTTGFGANTGAQSSVGNTNGGTSTSTGYPTSFTIQGSYYAYQDAQVTLSITSADPSNPRIDLVCATVQDAEWAGSSNQCVLQVITGTAGASPAPTTPPANSVIASSVWVPAAATSITSGDINDLRVFASSRAGQTGHTNIATSESRTNTAYGTLTTPDQVTNVVLPANGLIAVWYEAIWEESVAGAARAAVFVDSAQLNVTGGTSAAATGDTSHASTTRPLNSFPGGLASSNSSVAYSDPGSAFPQAVGAITPVSPVDQYWEVGGGVSILQAGAVGTVGFAGGPCYVYMAAGTYTVSVQFKASSGSVTASDRKLWVQAIPFT